MNIKSVRHSLFLLLLAVLLAALIRGAWFQHNKRGSALPGASEQAIEKKIFLFQAKLIGGAKLYRDAKGGNGGTAEAMLGDLVPQLFRDLKDTQLEAAPDQALPAAKLLLLARFIEEKDQADQLQGKLIGLGAEEQQRQAEGNPPVTVENPTADLLPNEQAVAAEVAAPKASDTAAVAAEDAALIKQLLNNLSLPAGEKNIEISSEARDWYKTKLDWFGLVYLSLYDRNEAERTKAADESRSAAQYAFQKIVVLTAAGTLFIAVVILSFLYLCYRWAFGKIAARPVAIEVDRDLLLETFTLYLTAMYFLPLLIEKVSPILIRRQITVEAMALNIAAILSVGLTLFWPRFWGAGAGQLRRTVALGWNGLGRTIRDLVIAPITYCGAWIPLSIMMLLFALLLKYLNIDPSSGAHPIVPFLVESKDPAVLIKAVILAVIVAPLIEELLFRGVFYSWLRARHSAAVSILASALIFASVHPQGAIGMLPLTYIGCVLAFLREWRGNLLSPMLAHACFNGGTMAMLLFFFK